MKDFKNMRHFPMVEKIASILSKRTQNNDQSFFKINVCYHLTKLASLMNTQVDGKGFGKHPVNFYGLNLAPSGYGLKKPTL